MNQNEINCYSDLSLNAFPFWFWISGDVTSRLRLEELDTFPSAYCSKSYWFWLSVWQKNCGQFQLILAVVLFFPHSAIVTLTKMKHYKEPAPAILGICLENNEEQNSVCPPSPRTLQAIKWKLSEVDSSLQTKELLLYSMPNSFVGFTATGFADGH